MSDIALPIPGAVPAQGNVTAFKLFLVAFIIFAILGALNLSLVRSKTEEKCDTQCGVPDE
jgi:hypothetical protein